MAIVLDYNQVAIAACMQNIYGNGSQEALDPEFVKHMIFNSIRMYNTRYQSEFGEMIIATDGVRSWRKEIFPEYKASRKISRERDDLDWGPIFDTIHDVRRALRDNFLFRVVHIENAEADDIIGFIGNYAKNTKQKLMIISGDKDFQQLHQKEDPDFPTTTEKYVYQFAPSAKKDIVCTDPEEFLALHVLMGDSGDGVPNVLSKDNHFIDENSGRAPTISAKMKKDWLRHWSDGKLDDSFFAEYQAGKIWHAAFNRKTDVHFIKKNYERNQKMIDLNYIPETVISDIKKGILAKPTGNRDKMMQYFADQGMDLMLDCMEDFT